MGGGQIGKGTEMSKYHPAPYTCDKCKDCGVVEVSYADLENGPTADPADEFGYEFCDCPKGHDMWYADCVEYEKSERAFFAGLAVSHLLTYS